MNKCKNLSKLCQKSWWNIMIQDLQNLKLNCVHIFFLAFNYIIRVILLKWISFKIKRKPCSVSNIWTNEASVLRKPQPIGIQENDRVGAMFSVRQTLRGSQENKFLQNFAHHCNFHLYPWPSSILGLLFYY